MDRPPFALTDVQKMTKICRSRVSNRLPRSIPHRSRSCYPISTGRTQHNFENERTSHES